MKTAVLALVVGAALAPQTIAALFNPLATFGGGDGWRAPREVVAGDALGTTTAGNYSYLGVGNGERGLAYNPATGHVLLVSRPSPGTTVNIGSAPFVRVLDGSTGADLGGFNMAGVAFGGGGVLNKIGATTDGAIYAANIGTNTSDSNPLRVYRWNNESSAMTAGGNTPPTQFFSDPIPNTSRLGDTMDVNGTGSNARLLFGNANGNGYAMIDSSATVSVVNSFSPTTSPPGPGSGAFDRGITFAGNANQVWGKGSEVNELLYRTTVTTPPSATRNGVMSFESSAVGQAPMDYVEIGGVPYLALADYSTVGGLTSATNQPKVFVYDMSNPSSPVLVASGSTVTDGVSVSSAGGAGTIAIANEAGQVAWGGTTIVGADLVTTLYALTSNQGIQAFSFVVPNPVPEAGSFAAVGLVGLVTVGAAWVRRRLRRAA